MTKKDYITIAQAISDGALINLSCQADVTVNTDTRRQIAHVMASKLAKDNDRFDRERFLKACGV